MRGMKLFSSLGSGKKLSFLKFSIVLVIVGFVGYFGIYKTIAVKQEKDRFLKAQASLEDLYSQIEAKIGKPDQVKREQSCSYSSVEFGKGSLRCGSAIYLIYTNRDYQTSNTLMSEVQPLVGTKLYERLARKELTAFVSSKQVSTKQGFSQGYKIFGGISCAVSYSYPNSSMYPSDIFTTTSSENFQISLSCSGDSIAEHFPVKN